MVKMVIPMRKILFSIFLVCLGVSSFAQERKIILKDYGPGPHVFYQPGLSRDKLWVYLDIDDDSLYEFQLVPEGSRFCAAVNYMIETTDTRFSKYHSPEENPPTLTSVMANPFLKVGDTIPSIRGMWFFYDEGIFGYDGSQTSGNYYAVFRYPKDDGWCYGWAQFYYEVPDNSPRMKYPMKLTVVRTAYCTIPNYPLRIGQTSLEETGASAVSRHVRNDAGKLMVYVEGKVVQHVMVYDILGKEMMSVDWSLSNEAMMPLPSLPTGVYVVVAILEDGSRFSQKIVI